MIKLPTLDDRTYADFANAARALIPTLSPEWTDHNPSDPGIVLVELLSWLAEIVLYRIDRVPDRSYRTFLGVLRGPAIVPDPQDPALLDKAPLDAAPLDAVALDEAIRRTVAQLRDRHRAITADDFEYLTMRRWPMQKAAAPLGVLGTVRRVLCLAQQSPASLVNRWKGASADGHFTVVVVPDSLSAARSDLASFAPTRRSALELDGKTGYVDCGNDTSLSVLQDLTLSAWIFPRSLGTRQGIVTKSTTGEYELVLEPSGTQATAAVSFIQRDGSAGCTLTAGAVAPRRWTHVAAVRAADGKAVTLFVDGNPVGSKTLANVPLASSAAVQIGRRSDATALFDGFVRDVAIWSSARSATNLGGDLQRVPRGADDPGDAATKPLACWRLDAAPAAGALVPDCETAAATPAAQRHRDGTLHGSLGAAGFRDAVQPLPAATDLTVHLANLFEEWRLLTTRVDVAGYTPLRIAVSATLNLRSDADPGAVQVAATDAIRGFLDPLTGWQGAGWPFGRAIYSFDLQSLLDAVPGVDFVSQVVVALADQAQQDQVTNGIRPPAPHEGTASIGVSLQPDELPSFASATLTIIQRSGAR